MAFSSWKEVRGKRKAYRGSVLSGSCSQTVAQSRVVVGDVFQVDSKFVFFLVRILQKLVPEDVAAIHLELLDESHEDHFGLDGLKRETFFLDLGSLLGHQPLLREKDGSSV